MTLCAAPPLEEAPVLPAGREPLPRPGGTPVDRIAAEHAARNLLVALGADLSDPDLRRTPARVAAAFAELLTPQPFTLTTFPNTEGYRELVVVRDIGFHSVCAHHLLPFAGVAHVGYVPGRRLVGLSKLARAVAWKARGLQVQERLTSQVAGWLWENLEARGVAVVLTAEHACMSLRGVQARGSSTVTSCFHGVLADDPEQRLEFRSLVGTQG